MERVKKNTVLIDQRSKDFKTDVMEIIHILESENAVYPRRIRLKTKDIVTNPSLRADYEIILKYLNALVDEEVLDREGTTSYTYRIKDPVLANEIMNYDSLEKFF